MNNLPTLLFIVIVAITSIAQADTIAVSRFSTEGLSGWERKSFKGETDYSVTHERNSVVVMAHSNASASGLIKKVKLDPFKYRYLNWKWKIEKQLKNRLEKTKAGDDYSARVYIVFPGFFFWQTKAINYVWSSYLPIEDCFRNPYTSNALMVVVETGPDKVGVWVTEHRDILADYRRLFGSEPRQIGAIAIMTDTDNTGGEATAWYGDITISTSPLALGSK